MDGVVCVVDAVFGRKVYNIHGDLDVISDVLLSKWKRITQLMGSGRACGNLVQISLPNFLTDMLRQIACADVILLNKIDMAQSEDELYETERLIQGVNPSAPIHRTAHANIDIGRIININAYVTVDHLSVDGFRERPRNGPDYPHDLTPHPKHYELRGISSLQVTVPPLSPCNFERLEEWIQRVLWDEELPKDNSSDSIHQIKVLRCKGLFVTDTGKEYILQGVQSMYDISEVNGRDVQGLPSAGKLVLIGKGLDEAARMSLLKVLGD